MHTRIHETIPFRDASGPTLRPGGLELTDRAVELCRFTPGSLLLDVGCGNGITVGHLRDRYHHDVRGVDSSLTLIAEGLQRDTTLRLSPNPAEALPVEDGSLDGIFCECVLSLLDDPVKALREFHRALRPGGKLALTDLYLRRVPGELESPCERYQRPRGIASSKDVQGWLRAAGFTGIVLWEDHTRSLQELAARIMLSHGSLECLSGLCGKAEGKPGYYLLVTEKM